MPLREDNLGEHLLPVPKELRRVPGACRMAPDAPLDLRVSDLRIERGMRDWLSVVTGSDGTRRAVDPRGLKPAASGSCPLIIRVAVDPATVERRDGYRLDIRPDHIELIGGSPAGCFHGLQTLRQLSIADCGLQIGRSASSVHHSPSAVQCPRALPCCSIVDWPDFSIRGLLLDVTRGRVPTLDTLKTVVDRLAALKLNQLQLNIEHSFVFSFDPEICGPDDGLTPDEVRDLDAYCRERFIELVPALATFGHMGRILSMPTYRHLAEIESVKTWEEMTWPERMRGLTLDCMNPEAHRLVERMWSDVLDAFSSPVVNICGDEPWDLGRGRNRDRFALGGKDEAYVEHIRRTHDVCAARGRTTQFWSDIVKNHPHRWDRLPRESTVLHWGYDDRADYERTSGFVAAGFRTFVCPGTSGWKRVINAIDVAERNISAFAAAGKKYGARGLVNTDWGDHGHFNMPACSWHGIALGAALAWSADHPTGDAFDRRFARTVLGVDDARGIGLLRLASEIAGACETWRLLWMPVREIAQDASLPMLQDADKTAEAARELRHWCDRVGSGFARDPQDVEPLTLAGLFLAGRFTELLMEKIRFAHTQRTATPDATASPDRRSSWAEQLVEAGVAYADLWRRRCKPSGLRDILGALSAAADDVRAG